MTLCMPASTAKKKSTKKAAKKATKAKNTKNPPKAVALPEVDLDLIEDDEFDDEPRQRNEKQAPKVKTIRICKLCLGVLEKEDKMFCSQRCSGLYQSKFNIFRKKPSKYKPEFANKKLQEYIEWVEEVNQQVFIENTKGQLTNLKQIEVPGKAGYALYIGITKPTMSAWMGLQPAFNEAMEALHAYQEIWLTNKVSEGLIEKGTANLLLGYNHGIIQKKETENKHFHMIGMVNSVYEEVERLEGELPPPSDE